MPITTSSHKLKPGDMESENALQMESSPQRNMLPH